MSPPVRPGHWFRPWARAGRLLTTPMTRVAIGLAILGVTSYVYLSLAGRQLSATGFASVSVLWAVIYIVGPGVFQPFEQQVGRSLAARLARGGVGISVPTRVMGLAGGVVLCLCAATLVFARPITQVLFGGTVSVLVALIFSYVALGAAYLYRGVLAGSGRFDLYGGQLGIEGAVRLAGCGLFWWWGSPTAGSFALLIPVAQAVSVLASARPRRSLIARDAGAGEGTEAGSGEPEPSGVGVGLGWLVAGSGAVTVVGQCADVVGQGA